MQFKKTLIALGIITGLLAPTELLAGGAKTVWVDSYTKSDGTYVSGHWRSPPDGTGISLGTSYVNPYSGKPQVQEHRYWYHINIFETGKSVCEEGHMGRPWSKYRDSEEAAAASSTWEVQECLRRVFYGRGLGHEEVDTMFSRIFTQSACRLETAPINTGKVIIDHEYTMTCIVPGQNEIPKKK